MVVRFLPVPDPDALLNDDPAPEREGLAEVVELRSRLLGAVAKSGDADNDAGEEEALSGPSGRRASRATSWGRGSAGSDRSGIGQSDQEAALPQGPKRTVTEDGVRILARRARSAGEVRRALIDLGHDEAEVEDVLAEFLRSGYLDDADLARALTTALRERSKASRSQIRRKLIDRKLDSADIETALGELDADDELALLHDAAQQRAGKMRDLDRTTAERRLLGFLARRGWSGESARSAASRALDAAGIRRSGAAVE